jgi:uncharacterized coiled-coil protein SlyX
MNPVAVRTFCPRILAPLAVLALAACPPPTTEVTPQTAKDTAGVGTSVVHAPPVRDTSEQRAARLELRVLEREAQIEELGARLDEARQEVVRAMAKLQTVASRAEAASAMAEAELAVQSLRAASGAPPPDLVQASALLQAGSAEFAKHNYGGAAYLANQAKSVAGAGKSRLGGGRAALRPGEVSFAVPLRLQAVARGNVRDGPGATHKVLFTLEPGAALIGYSYVEQWVHVADESGRSGWMFLSLVGRREPGDR